jgi:hypothetical protein
MMRSLATLKIAGRALRRNKLRTLLTMLGMIIGVGAVIAMVGIGNGAKSQIEAQIASMGQNVILVFSGSFSRGGVRSGWGGAGTLTIEDAEAIQREISGVTVISPEIRTRAQIAAGNQNWNTQILGESPDYFDIRQWPIVAGSSFTEMGVRSANKVAVIGKTMGPWSLGYHCFGVETFLLMSLDDPGRTKLCLDRMKEVTIQFGLAQIEPLFATFAANLQASRAYAPEPYTGRLTLWVSEATAASYAAALDAWSRLVPAGLDRTILPGDHYSLLRRPEVERLARELAAVLAGSVI